MANGNFSDRRAGEDESASGIDLDANPMPYIPALESDQLLRLREFSRGAHHSTSVVGLRMLDGAGEIRGVGSGLIVWDHENDPEFRIVTARHVVAPVLQIGNMFEVQIEVPHFGEGNVLPVKTVTVPSDSWILSNDDDLAVAPLPIAELPTDHVISGRHTTRLGFLTSEINPNVQLVGRWGETPDGSNVIVTRSGLLTTFQRPTVSVTIGDDQERRASRCFLLTPSLREE